MTHLPHIKMNNYITGNTIKELREKKKMTQKELADKLGVSDKTISKWETAKGYPDISILESLASALDISVVELLTGDYVTNQNVVGNMLRSKFYVCPVCGNVIHSMGEGVISCCGIHLPVLEAEEPQEMQNIAPAAAEDHEIIVERIDGDYFVNLRHEMTKKHYISFIAYVTSNKIDMIKLYPEQNAEAVFLYKGHGVIFAYCNKHGLLKKKI